MKYLKNPQIFIIIGCAISFIIIITDELTQKGTFSISTEVIAILVALIVVIQIIVIKKLYVMIKRLRVKTELLTQIVEMDRDKPHEKEDAELLLTAEKFIERMVLHDKITLWDVPAEIRMHSVTIYTYACRVSRNKSKERYVNDLETLKTDIDNCHSELYKSALMRRYKILCENIKWVK